MAQPPFSRREETFAQENLKKVQQEEQQLLEKLAAAREAQVRAMKRFTQAQERALQAETRLLAMRERLQTPRLSVESEQAADIQQTGAPGKQVLPDTHSQLPVSDPAQPIPAAQSTEEMTTDHPAPDRGIAPALSRIVAETPGSTPPPHPSVEPLAESLEEIGRKTALRPVRLAVPPPQDISEEETLLIAFSELAQKSADAASQEPDPNATDITTKIPVIRQPRHQKSEPA
jgi:hypothetical protein